jgi:hypothetical protein
MLVPTRLLRNSDSFASAKAATNVDFVREELLTARELGKPVLPVRLGVNPESVRSVLPQELRWLDGLQQVAWNGPSDTAALVRGIRSLSGLVPPAQPGSPPATLSGSAGASILSLASRRLVVALWRPTGAAAASLRASSGNFNVALAEAGLALVLAMLCAWIVHGDLGLYAIGRLAHP